MSSAHRLLLSVCLLLPAACCLSADWPTFAHDPQRTGWAAEERILSPENVANLRLAWKAQLKNEPKELTALTAPIMVSGVETKQGRKNVVYIAGSSDTVFAVDADTGAEIWTKALPTYARPNEKYTKITWLCPFGVNATPVADKKNGALYVIASDGKLHSLELGTGERKTRPFQFVPPFSKNWSLNLVDGVLYTAISQGCGGARSGIYALDLRDPLQPVARFLLTSRAGSAGVWGRAGAEIGRASCRERV